MKNIIMILLTVVSIVVMTGCASVFSKTVYDVNIDTNAEDKLCCKVMDISRQTSKKVDPRDHMVYKLKSYKEMSGTERFPNKFVIYVKGNEKYPSVMKFFSAHNNIWGSLYMGAENSGNLSLMYGVKPFLLADEATGCVYNLPKEVFIDMEMMRQAKNIAVREWINSDKQDSAIMINSPETGTFAFVIPEASDKVKKLKKGKVSKDVDLLIIKTKNEEIPFEIFNAEGELIFSGVTPARVSAVSVVQKFFILFHLKGAGFLIRAIPANPKNEGNISFNINIDPKKLYKSFEKYRKNPKGFYVISSENKKKK